MRRLEKWYALEMLRLGSGIRDQAAPAGMRGSRSRFGGTQAIGGFGPSSAKLQDVVGDDSTFDADHQAHGDALGFVVMGSVHQVHRSQSRAKTERGPYALSTSAPAHKWTHQRIRLVETFTQAALGGNRIGSHQAPKNSDIHLVLECPERSGLAGRIGQGARNGRKILGV